MPYIQTHVHDFRDSPYSETETKVIMQQVFQGLSYIHKSGKRPLNYIPRIIAFVIFVLSKIWNYIDKIILIPLFPSNNLSINRNIYFARAI